MHNVRRKGADRVVASPSGRLLGRICDMCEHELKSGDEAVGVVRYGGTGRTRVGRAGRKRVLMRFCKPCADKVVVTAAMRGGPNRVTLGIADARAFCYLAELSAELSRRMPYQHAEIEWAGERTFLVTIYYFGKMTKSRYTYDVRSHIFSPVSDRCQSIRSRV